MYQFSAFASEVVLSSLEHCATLLLRYLSIFTDLAAEKTQF